MLLQKYSQMVFISNIASIIQQDVKKYEFIFLFTKAGIPSVYACVPEGFFLGFK